MGDPRKIKKKYSKPKQPWDKESIEAGKILVKEYGLKNKKELWKVESLLKRIKKQAKLLIKKPREEQAQFLARLARLNVINPDANIENVLDLEVKNLLERRLQTQVYRTGIARTIKQARQFVTHGHIVLNSKKINVPSYLLRREDRLQVCPNSALNNPEHPERAIIAKKGEGAVKKEEEIVPMESEP